MMYDSRFFLDKPIFKIDFKPRFVCKVHHPEQDQSQQ